MKTVLEEVQLELKKEEEKRSELQLQYTRDRCSWELEKAELQCRIAQVAADGKSLINSSDSAHCHECVYCFCASCLCLFSVCVCLASSLV